MLTCCRTFLSYALLPTAHSAGWYRHVTLQISSTTRTPTSTSQPTVTISIISIKYRRSLFCKKPLELKHKPAETIYLFFCFFSRQDLRTHRVYDRGAWRLMLSVRPQLNAFVVIMFEISDLDISFQDTKINISLIIFKIWMDNISEVHKSLFVISQRMTCYTQVTVDIKLEFVNGLSIGVFTFHHGPYSQG